MDTLSFKEQLLLKLLDWPFLLTFSASILIYCFRKPLGNLISRGGITIAWGDKSLSISQLPEELNKIFASITDDIEDLKQQLTNLESSPAIALQPIADRELSEDDLSAARKRMLQALEDGKYRWRSIERLASIGAVSENQAESILRPLDEVVFSRGKSGRTIVRLTTR